jgi:hypothetical protein
MASGDEKTSFFDQAEKLLKKAEELLPGRGSYNLACLYALNKDPNECLKWLKKSRETKYLPGRSHLEKDTDLNNVRDLPWFKEFIEELT